MRFDIRNMALLCVLAAPVSAVPKKAAQSGATLVWSRGGKLEASLLSGGPIRLLRERRGTPEDLLRLPPWNFSPDGRQLTFADTPEDVDFFNAGAYREYVFLARFDTPARVLLAAYGPRAVYNKDSPSFGSPQFDAIGQKLILDENKIGQMMDDPSPAWIAIYDIKTRKRTFDSRKFIASLPASKTRNTLTTSRLTFSALSPDGNDVVCFAKPDDGDSVAELYTQETVAPPTRIIHFDLKRKSAEILCELDDQLSVERTTFTSNTTTTESPVRFLVPQFASIVRTLLGRSPSVEGVHVGN